MKHIKINAGQSPTQKNWKKCLEFLQSGKFDPTFVISHRLPLSDGAEAYKKFNQKKEHYLKVFLRPNYLEKEGLAVKGGIAP